MNDPAAGDVDTQRGHRLAHRVAAAAVAWVKDPKDTGVYARLIDHAAAYAAWSEPALGVSTGQQRPPRLPDPSPADDATSDVNRDVTSDPEAVGGESTGTRAPRRAGDLAADVLSQLRHGQPPSPSPDNVEQGQVDHGQVEHGQGAQGADGAPTRDDEGQPPAQ